MKYENAVVWLGVFIFIAEEGTLSTLGAYMDREVQQKYSQIIK